MPKKLPKGISNYSELINDNYYYVDKTKYIEKLESLADKRIMVFRPRKFGKSLFLSVLENYYNISKKDKFDKLFKDTYIGKNPTNLRNSYYILKFNFSGIDTIDFAGTIDGFRRKVKSGVMDFIDEYEIEYEVDDEVSAEGMLLEIISAFKKQKPNGKLYIIIDEYDHFANELLEFNTDNFKDLVSKNGKVRKWYEVLKEGTETVIDRIFMTGVLPITLDSMTSGFNIVKDLTKDEEFNEIFGFTTDELICMMNNQNLGKEEQELLLPIMKEYYDGYKFNFYGKEKMYNSNMCLTFLDDYIRLGKLPKDMVDVNIASDYKKLESMLNLCQSGERQKIIVDSISSEGLMSDVIEKFNPAKEFETIDLISMLFYLGYLTIVDERLGSSILKVPNKVMKELYFDYFLEVLDDDTNLKNDYESYNEIKEQLAYSGQIDKLVEMAQNYLSKLSNRDYIKFDEKYIKLIFYTIIMSLKSIYHVSSEMEIERKYPDLLIIPNDEEYYAVMIEFKYLKRDEVSMLDSKKKEAKKQIEEYSSLDEVKKIEKLKCYTIVAVNDKLYVDEIER